MAQNPYVNKVVFGNDTLVDLTEDSVTASNLLEGETAHNAAGAPVTGTAKQGHTIWNAIKTALTQRTKLWFADAKVTDDSTEQATKVEVVQLIDDESELTNAPDGVYQGDYDDAPEYVLDASMVAYGNGSVEDALDDRDTFVTIDYVIGASSGSNVDSRTTDLTQFKKIALGYTYGEASYIGYTEIPFDLFKRGVTLTVYNPMNTAYYIQAVWSDNTKVKMSYNVAANYRAVILGVK